MPFIIPDDCLKKLYSIRDDYEILSKQILNTSPQPHTFNLFLGAKDIDARHKQIKFINKWLTVLADKLQPYGYFTQLMYKERPSNNQLEPNRLYLYQINDTIECAAINSSGKVERFTIDNELTEHRSHVMTILSDSSKKIDETTAFTLSEIMAQKGYLSGQLTFRSEEEITAYLEALKILLTVYFYITSQINKSYSLLSNRHSNLKTLCDASFSLNPNNVIDDETQACCLLTTQAFLTDNQQLKKANHLSINDVFTSDEWSGFSNFINQQCNLLAKEYRHSYPCTTILMPLFEIPLSLIGYTIGYIGGDMVGKSNYLLSSKIAITAAFGSGLIFAMGPSMGMGILLLAPSYASKLLDNFFGVSMACLLGSAMGFVGKSLGWVAGMTLDSSLQIGQHVLLKSFELITASYDCGIKSSVLTGFELVEGHRFINGAKLDVVSNDKISSLMKDYQPYPITIAVEKNSFTINIGEKKAIFPWDLETSSDSQKLIKKFQQQEKKPIENDISEDNIDEIFNTHAI